MICHWFRHSGEASCIPVLTCQLHQELLAHGEHLTPRVNRSVAPSSSCFFYCLTWLGWMAWPAAISWIVLRPLIASMATLALNSGL